jgi:TolB protein
MNARRLAVTLICCSGHLIAQGLFENHGDIGDTAKNGSVDYSAATGDYRITGGGANIWAGADAFQFAWARISGDVTIAADVRFEGLGAVNHCKAVLMIRQSLDAGSPYADAALHGDGLTSLQFRTAAGANTQEIRSALNAPLRIRIERRGNQFTIFAGKPGQELAVAGPATVALTDPVYVGLGVCSHDANTLETAVFSNVKIENVTAQAAARQRYRSRISIFGLSDKSIRVLYTSDELFEAPNWSRDGKFLLSNSGGALYRIPVDGSGEPQPEKLDVGLDLRCNNDHGYTRDGKLLAISASSASSRGSLVYVVDADGSNRRQMTTLAPSYFHGWSPDGKWMAIVAQRDGNFDLFRIARQGGPEQRLTSNVAYDDGPDYAPDGKWIYFNSNRAGNYDIWRMPKEGAGVNDANAQRVTRDELEDWFPHPSPDGKWLIFLSFPKGTTGHNDKMDVQLRMIPLPGNKIVNAAIDTLAKIYGGQGTINVNSWSPDSKRFAFVAYEPLP